MLRLLHGAVRLRLPSTQQTRLLAIVSGLAICLLALLNCTNNAPSPADGAPGAERGTPSQGSPNQPVLAGEQETPASARRVTPDATPVIATSTQTPTSEPGPADDDAASTEIPAESAPSTPEAGTTSTSSPATAGARSSSPGETRDPHASITRLRIPSISVDAPVEVKSIDAQGVMQAPSSPDGVAWYDFSARPRDEGNVVFSGHLDYAGVGPAVFWQLGDVRIGEEITVMMDDGSEVAYRVTSVESLPATADATQVVASTGAPTITLITCDGDFDPVNQEYDERTVVTGERIE